MSAVREQFISGWRVWCRCGDDDELTATARKGFNAAANENENGGGERPRSADAKEAADYYLGQL